MFQIAHSCSEIDDMLGSMHGKKVKEESGEATLARVAKEMAKPRLSKSAREKDAALPRRGRA